MKVTVLMILAAAGAVGMGVGCSRPCKRDVIVVNPNVQRVTFHVLSKASEGAWVDSFPLKIIAGRGEMRECRITPAPKKRDIRNEIWVAELNGKEIFREKLSWNDLERRNFRIELPLVH